MFPAEISLGSTESGPDQVIICAVRDISLRKQSEREIQDKGRELAEKQRLLKSLTARLVLTEESERRRIAIGLHDDLSQTLAAAKMNLGELLETRLSGDDDSSARAALSLVERAIETTRTVTFELASAERTDCAAAFISASCLSACASAAAA